MGLPKITLPTTECFLPITKQTVRVRAFTLGEEKNLLIAKDAGSEQDVFDNILRLIQNCTDSDIDLKALPLPDMVAIFMSTIDMSKGTATNAVFVCHNEVDGKECNNRIELKIDLKDMQLEGKDHPMIIKIDDKITLGMKYPSQYSLDKIMKDMNHGDFDLFAECISEIYVDNEVYNDYEESELIEWVKTLPKTARPQFKEFFDSMPNFVLRVNVVCPKCGYTEEIVYRGLDGFFMEGSQE